MCTDPARGRMLSRPGEPTDAPPGSEMKVRVMIERAARREPLFHALDGPYCAHNNSNEPAWQPEPVLDTSDMADISVQESDALALVHARR